MLIQIRLIYNIFRYCVVKWIAHRMHKWNAKPEYAIKNQWFVKTIVVYSFCQSDHSSLNHWMCTRTLGIQSVPPQWRCPQEPDCLFHSDRSLTKWLGSLDRISARHSHYISIHPLQVLLFEFLNQFVCAIIVINTFITKGWSFGPECNIRISFWMSFDLITIVTRQD